MAMKFQVGNWLAFGRFEATEEGMRFKVIVLLYCLKLYEILAINFFKTKQSELVTIHMMHCILGFQNQYYAVP